jgi:redox-sensing transcriptional repressor
MNNHHADIPLPVIRRLAKYLSYIDEHLTSCTRESWVSSKELADAHGLSTSTVRYDLSFLDFSGVSRRGYSCGSLREVLISTLGLGTPVTLAIVGAGNLGRALAVHQNLLRNDFHVRAIFDKKPELIGTHVGPLVVEPMNRLAFIVEHHAVEIGVIAVPGSEAQHVADALIDAGVKGLLNFATTHVHVPPHIPVTESRIVTNLRELACIIHRGNIA